VQATQAVRMVPGSGLPPWGPPCVPRGGVLCAQVADFGLAKIAPERDTSEAFTVTSIMGTQGYVLGVSGNSGDSRGRFCLVFTWLTMVGALGASWHGLWHSCVQPSDALGSGE